ncbi:MAG: hypothetical protein NZ895_05050 [Archaeoglobaceae archaeon]|nr:hypothetical protein [Archaeoglobaceae archaeon]MCX8152752.1 hypothetical protein [Archaeoglobaceae archaeon]MDW8013459.1 hypothetical protein [Archaeoglobaceae archaeon]
MKKCETCNNWSPHIHYSFVGYCLKREMFYTNDFYCELFEELKIDGTIFWCKTCGSSFYIDEIEFHKDHEIFHCTYIDSSFREEIYEG